MRQVVVNFLPPDPISLYGSVTACKATEEAKRASEARLAKGQKGLNLVLSWLQMIFTSR